MQCSGPTCESLTGPVLFTGAGQQTAAPTAASVREMFETQEKPEKVHKPAVSRGAAGKKWCSPLTPSPFAAATLLLLTLYCGHQFPSFPPPQANKLHSAGIDARLTRLGIPLLFGCRTQNTLSWCALQVGSNAGGVAGGRFSYLCGRHGG